MGRGAAEEIQDIGVEVVFVQPQQPKQLGAAAVRLAQDAQQQVLGADVALAQYACLRRGALHRLAGMGAEPLHRRTGDAAAQPLRQEPAQGFLLRAPAQQDLRAQAALLAEDAQQQVLRTHEAVSQLPGAEARVFDGLLGPGGELFVALHASHPSMKLCDACYYTARRSPKAAKPCDTMIIIARMEGL